MNNKFENKNEKEKLFKKPLLDRTLQKNTGLNFCLSLYQKPCIRFHVNFLIIKKLPAEEIFLSFFPKNKIHSSASYAHLFKILKHTCTFSTDFNFNNLFLTNHSPTNSCHIYTRGVPALYLCQKWPYKRIRGWTFRS